MQLCNPSKRALFPVGALLSVAAPLVVAAPPAHAIVLQQKWTVGEQLAYDVLADGTFNIQLPPDADNFLAGLPLEIDLTMTSQAALDTLSVDENGTGTIVPRLSQLLVKGDMLGQKLNVSVANGKGSITMNGKAMGAGKTDWSKLTNPTVAMQISKFGRVQSFVPNQPTGAPAPNTPAPAATAPNAPATQPTDPATQARAQGKLEPRPKARGGMPFDMQSMISTMLLRALPTLWPDHEVNIGDKWTTELSWPTSSPADGDATGTTGTTATTPTAPLGTLLAPPANGATPLGKFDFTLKGEEEVAGRKAERIGIKGVVDVDETKANSVIKSLPQGGNNAKGDVAKVDGAAKAPAFVLQHARQEMSGDLWFDAAAGQIVRVEVDVQSTVKSHMPPAPNIKAAKPNAQATDSSMAFNGTIQMQLRKVSFAGTPGVPTVVPPTVVN